MNKPKLPFDLAEIVAKELKRRKKRPPPKASLIELFQTMYFSSLMSEEGRSILFHIVYIDPANADPSPPERIVSDRWRFIPFQDAIPFSVSALAKLALATDPRSSSLAVYPDRRGKLCVSGLIDQGNRYWDFVNFDEDSGPERPGLFQASIRKPGCIVVYIEYELIAELRVDSLFGHPIEIFNQRCPVWRFLRRHIPLSIREVRAAVSSKVFDERGHWVSSLEASWGQTMCRLLLRARNFGHGGAYLFTDVANTKGLNIKYPLHYERLSASLRNHAINEILATASSDVIHETFLSKETESLPIRLYLDEVVHENEVQDIKNEVDGCLWFISLLTRVDGLVLLQRDLTVRGFGVEITVDEEPKTVTLLRTQKVH